MQQNHQKTHLISWDYPFKSVYIKNKQHALSETIFVYLALFTVQHSILYSKAKKEPETEQHSFTFIRSRRLNTGDFYSRVGRRR
jgi:hypothetical protein